MEGKPKSNVRGLTIPSENLRKRPADPSSQPSIVLPNKVSARDPRLQKVHQSAELLATPSLSLPNFSLKEVVSKTGTFNSKISRSEQPTPESQQTSNHLSKYLKLNSSLNIKSNQETIGSIYKASANPNKCSGFSGSSKKPVICDITTSQIVTSEFVSIKLPVQLKDIPLPSDSGKRDECEGVQENQLLECGVMPTRVEKSKPVDSIRQEINREPSVPLQEFKCQVVDLPHVRTAMTGASHKLPSMILRDPRIRRMLVPQDSRTLTVRSNESNVHIRTGSGVPTNMSDSQKKSPDTKQPSKEVLNSTIPKLVKDEKMKMSPLNQVARKEVVNDVCLWLRSEVISFHVLENLVFHPC